MELSHEIDFGSGYVIVPAPKNFESAELDVIFTKDKARASLANLTLIWQGWVAKKIFDVYESGKTGGKGVSFALPYRVKVCDLTLAFPLMLVLGHSSARFSCDHVEIPAWQAQGMDWFEKECQAYSFWHLYKNLNTGDPGKIQFTDFLKTPYEITDIPNYTQVVSLSFQELMLIWQLRELILTFTEKSTEIVADTTTSATPVVGFAHIWVTIAHVTSITLRVAAIAGYVILIFKYAQDLMDNIIQRKKYKLCMREKDLWLKLTAFLKINTFSSSIYASGSAFENATWMPGKIVMPKVGTNVINNFIDAMFDRPENEENNTQSFGYFDGLFSDFVQTMEVKYNAEAKIIGGVLKFEPINSYNIIGAYQLPNTGDLGYTFNLPNPFRTNLSELSPYYGLFFQIDESELNTLHRYRGTSAAVQILSPYPINKYSGWGQGKVIDLGSALAKRKESLTKIQEFVEKLLQVVDVILSIIIIAVNVIIVAINLLLSIINAILQVVSFGAVAIPLINIIVYTPLAGLIQQRIGWMQLSNDSFSIPKTFIGTMVGSDWELDPNTESNMSALSLLNNFHGSNLATRGNQWLLYDNNKSRFCCPDYFKIASRNIFLTSNGQMGKFDSMKWTLAKESARDINYRVKETYLMGLTEKLILDGTP